MATVHDEIDNWLAADLYGELSESGAARVAYASRRVRHLPKNSSGNQNYEQNSGRNSHSAETRSGFRTTNAAGFRNRIPEKSGLIKSLYDLMRFRTVQVTAVVAVLLGLVQLGRTFTMGTATTPRIRDRYANKQLFEPPLQFAATSQPGRAGALDKSDELAAGKPEDLALPAPPPSLPASRSDFHEDAKSTVYDGRAGQDGTTGDH